MLRVTQQKKQNQGWSSGALASRAPHSGCPPPPCPTLPYAQCRLGEPRMERV